MAKQMGAWAIVCAVVLFSQSVWGATVDAYWTGNGGDNKWGNAEESEEGPGRQ